MYPTGGYGHFLYKLLTEHFEFTVKVLNNQLMFNKNGNSHDTKRYTETFALGRYYYRQNLKDFKYGYQILDSTVEQQIEQGKHFLVLADVGNKGDNIYFLKRFFPQATIVRVYAETFEEKLIVWTNAMTKSHDEVVNNVYAESIMPKHGIAIWAKKYVDDLTDQDAINCMIDFFKSDFAPYGKFFSRPVPDVLNFSVRSFFAKNQLIIELHKLADQLGTRIINTQKLDQLLSEFYVSQNQLSLLDNTKTTFSLVRQALNEFKNKN
jgi:hypothetical protein